MLYLNSTFQKYVISHCIAIGQQFQSSSSKSNCILVFHRAGTETKTSQGTLFKSLGHDFISVKTTYSYFSTQRRWIYHYDSCVVKYQITMRNFEVPWRFKNFSSLRLNFPLRNSNEAMQAHPLTTSGPAPFTVHAHHAAQTVIATTTRWLVSWQLALIWQCHLSVCLINIFSERKEGFSIS